MKILDYVIFILIALQTLAAVLLVALVINRLHKEQPAEPISTNFSMPEEHYLIFGERSDAVGFYGESYNAPSTLDFRGDTTESDDSTLCFPDTTVRED